ncbi:hypothetical protein GQ600_4185 [Phytophthora cactorum]|nr:hypothetical protein GQ600_4185 [Phytophthora cactorum]
MELVDNLRIAVLRQREEEVTNFFTTTEDLTEFMTAHEPAPGVTITVKMCCCTAARLHGDNGSPRLY